MNPSDLFEPDELDQENILLYKEFDTENLSAANALKKFAHAFGKTALYLIQDNRYKEAGTLSIFLLAHLSIELHLKSLLYAKTTTLPTTHDLDEILLQLRPHIALKEFLIQKIVAINEVGLNGFGFRYPVDIAKKAYKNFTVELLPESNYLRTLQKDNNLTVTRGAKQSSVKNYLQLIEDIGIVLDALNRIE